MNEEKVDARLASGSKPGSFDIALYVKVEGGQFFLFDPQQIYRASIMRAEAHQLRGEELSYRDAVLQIAKEEGYAGVLFAGISDCLYSREQVPAFADVEQYAGTADWAAFSMEALNGD